MWQRLGAILVLTISAQAAAADEPPRIVTSFGYQSLTYQLDLAPLPANAVCIAFCSFPRAQGTDSDHGWFADVAVGVSNNVALVGKAGGTYASDGGFLTNANPNYSSSSTHQFLAGVRVTTRPHERVHPFAHVLVGRAMASITGAPGSVSRSAGTLNVGGGLDLMFNAVAGVRIGGDWVHFSFEGLPADIASFSAGFVLAR